MGMGACCSHSPMDMGMGRIGKCQTTKTRGHLHRSGHEEVTLGYDHVTDLVTGYFQRLLGLLGIRRSKPSWTTSFRNLAASLRGNVETPVTGVTPKEFPVTSDETLGNWA